MVKDWRNINDMYWTPRNEEPEPEPIDMDKEEEKQPEKQVEVRLSDPKFIRPDDGYKANKPCKMQVSAKYLKKTNRAKVLFDVFSSYKENEVQEYSILEGFIEDGIAIAEMKYLPLNEDYANDRDKAEDATYEIRFVARHNTGEKPVESELLEVPCSEKSDINFIEIPDVLYNLNSAVPCLNEDRTFISAVSSACKYVFENGNKEMIILGHTDKAGDVEYNMTLSEHRAAAIKSIFDGNSDDFVSAVADYNTVSDIQQNLNTMNKCFGWATDCGKVDNSMGPKTKGGIKMFQAEYNLKFEKDITVDGIAGKQTWGAIFEVFQDLIKEDFKKRCPETEFPVPTYGYNGDGIYACGPWFPVKDVKSSYLTKESRRVEIGFYEKGKAPVLEIPENPQVEIKPTECSVFTEDKSTLNSVPIETLEKVPTDTCIAFFFDGTGQNRDNDIPAGKDSNISKIFELYIEKENEHQVHYQKAHYHIGVGTDSEKWYDDWIETIILGPVFKIIKDIFTKKTLDNFTGLVTGKGGQKRIKDALDQLSDFMKMHKNVPEIKVDVFGFSRGAALARHFTNLIYDMHQIKVRFLGIFDTVGSFGLGGNDINIGYALDVHADKVNKVVHYTAKHEYRSLFDLTSIKRLAKNHDEYRANYFNTFMETKPLPPNMIERDFAGAHADVGGGYEPNDKKETVSENNKRNELSRIPLYAMVDEARKAEVPLMTIDDYRKDNLTRYNMAFTIPDDLQPLLDARNNITRYNSLTDKNNEDFKDIFKNYIHDSRYFIDVNSETRSVFYNGVY